MARRTFLIFLLVIVSSVVSPPYEPDENDSYDYFNLVDEIKDLSGGDEKSVSIGPPVPNTTCTDFALSSTSIRPSYEFDVTLSNDKTPIASLSSTSMNPTVILPSALRSLEANLSSASMTPANALTTSTSVKVSPAITLYPNAAAEELLVEGSEPSGITPDEAVSITTLDEYEELLRESGLSHLITTRTTMSKRIKPVSPVTTKKTTVTTTTSITQPTSVAHPETTKRTELSTITAANSSPKTDTTPTTTKRTESSTITATNSSPKTDTTMRQSTKPMFSSTIPTGHPGTSTNPTVMKTTVLMDSSSITFLTSPITIPTSHPKDVRHFHLLDVFNGLPYRSVSKPLAVMFLLIPGVVLSFLLISYRIYSLVRIMLFVLRE